MASQYDLPYTGPQVETLLAKISELESEMPSKTSDLTNDSGFITSENVPTKTSDLNNDSGFITNAPVAAEAARAQAAEALLATISSLQAEISRATGVEGTLQDLIDGIAAKIPSAATEQNQLADKAFVNSSIATASATFRGTYISLVALQAVAADENDYGYVISTDAVGNTIYNRYKYANSMWTFEYAIANPIFDSSQWAAINSAVTAELVAKLSALPDNATLTAALAAKQDVIDDLSSIRSKANSAYQKPSGGIPASDIAEGVIPDVSGKVNTSDIADNLTTNDATKVLSAKQGKVLNENLTQLGQEVNGLAPLTEYVGRLESTSAKIANISTARYMVVPVGANDVVKLTAGAGGCFYYVVSEFTYNPTLPYDLILATGETSKHNATEGNTDKSTMPADAAYIIVRGTISLLTINGRDILKSLDGVIKDTNEMVDELTERVDYVDIGFSQKFDGIIGNQFVGDLTTGKEIVTGATKKYAVISVKGGQVFKYKRMSNPATRFYVVSEFTLNPALPYNLVLATGETTYHIVDTANYEYSLTLPNDAKYIIMMSEYSGVNYLPEYLVLDGENLLNTYPGNLGLTKEIDASSIRETEGYYRAVTPYRFYSEEGWYATPLIPVYPGDIIETNTTVNAPYNTVGHLCFDGDGAFVQVLQMANGKTEITQAMVDAGVRFVGISFVKADTPTPSVSINRQTLAEMSVQISDTQEKVQENEEAIATINGKCRILVKSGSSGFDVEVYNKKGGKVRYHFTRYLKVWDSLEYVDGEGQTQTKTNFTSADMWGNDAIYKDSTYIIQGNTNFICNVYGDTRHIGDQHGNEVLKVCKFFADGVVFDPLSLSTALECHELRWEWKSEVYSPNLSGTNVYTGAYPRFDTDGNPIVNYTHYMMGTLNDANEMKLDNRLCIKQDGLKFNEAYGAMLECNFGDFTQVCIANAESTLNAVANDGTATPVFSDVNLSVNPNQYADKAVMIGNGFVVEQSINVVSPKNATPNIHCQFYTNRLKNYLMPVKGNTYKVEDWQLDEFNTGDQIRVLTYRKIDI